tara:strand:- start:4407 stop:4601 length:195 start_codon:yes stop_codon:yes gene_type:complete
MNEDTLDFKLTIEEVNLVLQGLGELPAKLSINIINSIQTQAASQMQPQSDQAASQMQTAIEEEV